MKQGHTGVRGTLEEVAGVDAAVVGQPGRGRVESGAGLYLRVGVALGQARQGIRV